MRYLTHVAFSATALLSFAFGEADFDFESLVVANSWTPFVVVGHIIIVTMIMFNLIIGLISTCCE
eukprot:SAG11_NODE_474_length_9142_cov_6.507907_11_plen_65_part_00